VLLGRGDGTFTERQELAGFQRPQDVAVADFDADGIEDLALAGFQSDRTSVTILRGTGDGRFTTRGGYAVPAQLPVKSLAIGDFDGDGDEDFAAVSESLLSVRLGRGDGTFAGGTDQAVGQGIVGAVRAEDLDGDGLDDLALTLRGEANRLSVVTSIGDGTFAEARLAALPSTVFELATGDFDGDGHEDLAVADSRASAVSVRLGNGDATFRDGGEIPTGGVPTHMAAGDLDGDGSQDLAIAAANGNAANVRLGTGPAPLAENRLLNGGFEQGLGVTLPGEGPAIPGWTTTGGMTFARYGAHPLRGFPSWLDAAHWAGGRNLLWGGTRGPLNTAVQVVDVAAEAGAIDAGRTTARVSAELGGGVAVLDQMAATADFMDAAGGVLGSAQVPPVSAEQRRRTTTLLHRETAAPVPPARGGSASRSRPARSRPSPRRWSTT